MTNIKTRDEGLLIWGQILRTHGGDTISLPMRGVMYSIAGYSQTRTGAEVRPSLQRLATELGVSRRTVSTHVNAALSQGWLRVVRKSSFGSPTVYQLTVPIGRGRPDDTTEAHQPAAVPLERTPAAVQALEADVEDEPSGRAAVLAGLIDMSRGEPVLPPEPQRPLPTMTAAEERQARAAHERMLRDEGYSDPDDETPRGREPAKERYRPSWSQSYH